MKKIRVKLGERSYGICIGENILSGIGACLKAFRLSRKTAIISNPAVYNFYGETVFHSLRKAGFDPLQVVIPDGEEYKNNSVISDIYGKLLEHKLDRNSAVIALGGGVVGDMAGFTASTYMRGIPYVQIPTTLLAQVDSSVGGKTGVNHKLGKNMIGTFYQPRLVWIDTNTLKTLPERELKAGLAEAIKYGVIKDKKLFKFLEDNKDKVLGLDKKAVSCIIQRSCGIKAGIVSKDERESGLRAILNYGHTIGHAIETVTGYTRFLHGEAVAIGMHLEAKLSLLLRFLREQDVSRIKSLLDSYGLPTEIPADADKQELLSSMQLDKKTAEGKLTFILPEKIGRVRIQKNIDIRKIQKVLTLQK